MFCGKILLGCVNISQIPLRLGLRRPRRASPGGLYFQENMLKRPATASNPGREAWGASTSTGGRVNMAREGTGTRKGLFHRFYVQYALRADRGGATNQVLS